MFRMKKVLMAFGAAVAANFCAFGAPTFGVVESGCKCVVQQRLDLSGMHWSLQGAEALLPIRALYKSGRLDEFNNWRVRDLKQVAFIAA